MTRSPVRETNSLAHSRRSASPEIVPLFDMPETAEPGEQQTNEQAWKDTRGVVITPHYIVDLMVVQAVEARLGEQAWDPKALQELTWLDPATGDGAFLQGIIRHYANVGIMHDTELLPPRIVAVDRSSQAINYAKNNVQLACAEHFGAEAAKHIEFRVGDALELFSDSSLFTATQESFDIVIANPPYIRHSHLSTPDRRRVASFFPSLYNGSADYFTYFFAAALNAVNSDGVVAFITPASFIRNAAGRRLRQHINHHAALYTILDLDELPIFEQADVHTAISILSAGQKQGHINFKRFGSLAEVTQASSDIINFDSRELRFTATDGWHFSPVSRPRYRLSHSFMSLEDQGIQVRSGIRSGAAAVFLLDNQQAQRFSERSREKWLRRAVVPTDIQRHSLAQTRWLVWTPSGSRQPDSEILSYLETHRAKLESRPEVKNGATPWYGLRPCAYSDLLLSECIIGPDITSSLRFALKPAELIVSDGAFAIQSSDPAVAAILNSSWAEEFFRQNTSSVGSLESKGRFRIKANILRKFPLPDSTFTQSSLFSELRKLWSSQAEEHENVQNEIDKIVNCVYRRYEW